MPLFTVANIALVIATILAILALLQIYKTRTTRNWALGIAGVLLGMWVISYMGILPQLQQPWAIPPTEAPVMPLEIPFVPGELCPVEDTTITLAAQDKYTSAASGGTHRYRVCNAAGCAPAKTLSDAGTFTTSPGDILKILWMNGATTGYFSSVTNVTVPCSGVKTFFTNLINNGSLTTSVWTEEGYIIDGATNNETLDAGDVVSLDMELKGQYQKEFPYGLVLVIEYNKTSIDEVVITSDAGELRSISIPQAHASVYSVDSARKAYVIPPVISTTKQKYVITIDVDDSVNPEVVGSDILFTYFPLNYFINEKNGGEYEGPAAEDEENAVTRVGQFQYTLETM